MSFTPYKPTTRLPKERVTLHNNQLARFISVRTGYSATALSNALRILSTGITDALAEGFNVHWMEMGTFEPREMKPRIRYHRAKKEKYMSETSVVVHFKKSDKLTQNVRAKASARLSQCLQEPTVKTQGDK